MAKGPRLSVDQRATQKAERDAQRKADKEQKAAEKARLAAEESTRKKRDREAAKAAKPNGSNSANMNDAERQDLFLRHANHWARCEADVRAAIKKREDVEKLAKEDGFTKKALGAYGKMSDPKSDAKMRAEMRMLAQVAMWMGKPLNFQGSLFGAHEPKSEAVVTDEAYAGGRNASATGQPRRVPTHYPPGFEAFNAWLSGFDDHQKELHGAVGRGPEAKAAGGDFAARNSAAIADGDDHIKRVSAGLTSGTPVTRSAFNEQLERQAERTHEIIKNAGGTPAAETSSQRLAREQGVDDEE